MVNLEARANGPHMKVDGGNPPVKSHEHRFNFFKKLLPCTSYEDCMQSGRIAMNEGKYPLAAHHYRSAAKKMPSSAEAQFLLGKALYEFCYVISDFNLLPSKRFLNGAIMAFEEACCLVSPTGDSKFLYEAHFCKAKLIYDFKSEVPERMHEAFMSMDSIVCFLDVPQRGVSLSEVGMIFHARELREKILFAIKEKGSGM